MCLIAYCPAGTSVSRDDFAAAHSHNSDGIGVMSAEGVTKFYGRKMLKRARKHAENLAAAGIAHAVHWRYATHGSPGLKLTHPFQLPERDIWLMHNGVLARVAQTVSSNDESDTSAFAALLHGAPLNRDDVFWNAVEDYIGPANKMVLMFPGSEFLILNEDLGTWLNGVWYSNTYSLARTAASLQEWYDTESGGAWWHKAQTITTGRGNLITPGLGKVLPYRKGNRKTYDTPGDYGLPYGSFDEMADAAEARGDFKCRHGVPWSDFCGECDQSDLGDFSADMLKLKQLRECESD